MSLLLIRGLFVTTHGENKEYWENTGDPEEWPCEGYANPATGLLKVNFGRISLGPSVNQECFSVKSVPFV